MQKEGITGSELKQVIEKVFGYENCVRVKYAYIEKKYH
jgi:hypothetical protein